MTDPSSRAKIQELERRIAALEASARIAPTRQSNGGGGSLPAGKGRWLVLQILDEGGAPAKGYDDVRFRTGEIESPTNPEPED